MIPSSVGDSPRVSPASRGPAETSSVAGTSGTLEAHAVHVHYEGLVALGGVDLRLDQSEILGLIGPNGAGKTTMVNVLTGFTRPSAGSVVLNGLDVTGWSPDRISRAGIKRTFQNVRLFEGLSIVENVALGAIGAGIGRQEATRIAEQLLARVDISRGRAAQLASGLPHGEARVLGVLRALAARPKYVLLDEPAAGLNEAEGNELVSVLAAIPEEFGCGVMVIEHDMRVIMRLCHRVHVLDYGKTLSSGSPAEVRENAAVKTAYLGTRRAKAGRATG